MALVRCKECGDMVSDGASKCPKCGVDSPNAQWSTIIDAVQQLKGGEHMVWPLRVFRPAELSLELSASPNRADVFFLNESCYVEFRIGMENLSNAFMSGIANPYQFRCIEALSGTNVIKLNTRSFVEAGPYYVAVNYPVGFWSRGVTDIALRVAVK